MKHYKNIKEYELLNLLENITEGTPTTDKRNLINFAFEKIASETWRKYHSWDNHIFPMLLLINERKGSYTEEQKEAYIMAALFHDIIYDVKAGAGDNEKKSAVLWRNLGHVVFTTEFVEKVAKIIEATYGHESDDPFVREFLKLDLNAFAGSLKVLLEQEKLLRKEFAVFDWNDYKENSIKFLDGYSKNSVIKELGASDSIKAEIEYLKFLTPNIAIYPGSFNPYHIGHEDIRLQGEEIFDKVIIAFGQNSDKKKVKATIPEALKHVQVDTYEGLLSDYVHSKKYSPTVIRGLRNGNDLAYEQNKLKWIKELDDSGSSIKMVSIFANPKYDHISSSDIKSLMSMGGDKAEFAQKFILK